MKPISSVHADKTTEAAVDVLLICAMDDEYNQVREVTDGLTAVGAD
ncbi:hypothetical protein ABXJ76_05930 [Methylobacter sp. G7]